MVASYPGRTNGCMVGYLLQSPACHAHTDQLGKLLHTLVDVHIMQSAPSVCVYRMNDDTFQRWLWKMIMSTYCRRSSRQTHRTKGWHDSPASFVDWVSNSTTRDNSHHVLLSLVTIYLSMHASFLVCGIIYEVYVHYWNWVHVVLKDQWQVSLSRLFQHTNILQATKNAGWGQAKHTLNGHPEGKS